MYWVTILVLLIYMVLVWVSGSLLHLHGSDIWILRIVLALLGLIAAGAVLWYQRSVKESERASPGRRLPAQRNRRP